MDPNGVYLEDKENLSEEEKVILKEIKIAEDFVIETQGFDFSKCEGIEHLDVSLLMNISNKLKAKTWE